MYLPPIPAECGRSTNGQIARSLEVVTRGIESDELEYCAQLTLRVVDEILVPDDTPAAHPQRFRLLEAADRPGTLRPGPAATVEAPAERVHRRLHDGAAVAHENQQ